MYNKSFLLTTEIYGEHRFESALAGAIMRPAGSQSKAGKQYSPGQAQAVSCKRCQGPQ